MTDSLLILLFAALAFCVGFAVGRNGGFGGGPDIDGFAW